MTCFALDPRSLIAPRRLAWCRWSLGVVLLCFGLAVDAQSAPGDPPSRVARLSAQQGRVSFSPAGDDRWYEAIPNRPLTAGDRLWADRNTRAELHLGSAALRLDEQSLLEFSELNDQLLRFTLQRGSLQLRVRDDMAGERIEFDTGNLALVIERPGAYQIDTDPNADLTQVTVLSGSAVVYGDGGVARPLGNREQLAVSGRDLAAISAGQVSGNDFARWVAERNRIEDQSVSARYVSREVVGYQQLDAYGDWQNDASYGAVWYPRNVDADWAPYREGSWVEVAPWGLTWVDSAPWGFAPSHYGRWARFGPRWGWVPGRQAARPVYAPALVGFIGGGPRAGAPGGPGGLPIGNGRQGVGWFPLAPGEPWRPDYRASPRYIDRLNRMVGSGQSMAPRPDGYANQRQPDAVTVVSSEAFGRRAISRRDTIRLPETALIGARVGQAPALPQHFAPDIGRAPSGFAGRSAAPPPRAGVLTEWPAAAPGAMRPQANLPLPLPQRMPLPQDRHDQQVRQDGTRHREDADPRGPSQQRLAREAQEVQQHTAQQAARQQQEAQRQAQENQQRAALQQRQQQAGQMQQRQAMEAQQQQQQAAQQQAQRQAQEARDAQQRAAQQQQQQQQAAQRQQRQAQEMQQQAQEAHQAQQHGVQQRIEARQNAGHPGPLQGQAQEPAQPQQPHPEAAQQRPSIRDRLRPPQGLAPAPP